MQHHGHPREPVFHWGVLLVTVEGHVDTDNRGDGVIRSESSLTSRACVLSELWEHLEDFGGAGGREKTVYPAFISHPQERQGLKLVSKLSFNSMCSVILSILGLFSGFQISLHTRPFSNES